MSLFKKLHFIFIWITLFLIFFIAGFNFIPFTDGSHSSYASEIVCSGPSRELNCSPSFQASVQLFRGYDYEPTQLPDYGTRYVSSSFANFLNIFIESTDSLRRVILKTYGIKSLIASYLVTFSLLLVKKFKYLSGITTKLLLVTFSFPYLFFGASGVYPAPIAALAVIPIFSILKIMNCEKLIPPKIATALYINFGISMSLIISNRFETSAFVLLGVFMWSIYTFSRERKNRTFIILAVSTTCFAIAYNLNRTFRESFLESISGQFKVLSQDQANNSILVNSIGNSGLSLISPLTFVDNSTRNLNDLIFSDNTNVMLKVSFSIISWIPIFLLITRALKTIFYPMFNQKSLMPRIIVKRIPPFFVMIVFFLVPVYARTVWFFWYLVPLLVVFVFFVDYLEDVERNYKSLIFISIFANAVYFVLVVRNLGAIYLLGVSIDPPVQIFLGLSLGLIAFKLVKSYVLVD